MKLIAALIVAPLKFLFTHRKALFICVIAVIAFVVYRNFTGSKPPQTVEQVSIPIYEQIAPDTAYVIRTPTRLYYVNEFTLDEQGRYTLTDFYFYDREKWEKGVQPLPLGDIKVQTVKR